MKSKTAKPKSSPRKYDPIKSRAVPETRAPKIDVHEAITAKIVAAIEAGAGTFEMPWHRPGVAFTIPKNALTTKPYNGSNILSLWIDADDKKFEHQIWSTYKQWEEIGAQVRKGEKGSLIVKVRRVGAEGSTRTGSRRQKPTMMMITASASTPSPPGCSMSGRSMVMTSRHPCRAPI